MYQKDSPRMIQSMFNSIAKRYDLTNAVVSFSLHKLWNRALVRNVMTHSSPQVLLDLCSGTGDIAFTYLRQAKSPCHAYLIDFSSEMLEYAKQKEKRLSFRVPHHISYIEANVQTIPLKDHCADCATMAYGIRNVQDPAQCIQDVFRVLKPGGLFGILELTQPHSLLLRTGHQLYLRTILPLFGKWLTYNQDAYRYLCQSIQLFKPTDIENLLKQTGFINTRCQKLMGGIATLLIGMKNH